MAEPPRQPQEQGPHQLPKEESSPPSEPPPAYVPPAGAVLLSRLTQLFNNNPEIAVSAVSRPEPPAPLPNPSPHALAHLASISVANASQRAANPANPAGRLNAPGQAHEPDPWDDDHSECEDLKSPVTIRINAGIRISSNSNIVTLTASPAEMCASIAQSVVAGMREASGGVGIPMIDEDGHPRPLRIEVDAGLDINGVGNIVGREDVVQEILRIKAEAAARRAAAAADTQPTQTPASSRAPSGLVVPGVGLTPGSSRVPSGSDVAGGSGSGPWNANGNGNTTAPASAPASAPAPADNTVSDPGPDPAPIPAADPVRAPVVIIDAGTPRRTVSAGEEIEQANRGRYLTEGRSTPVGVSGGNHANGGRSLGRARACSL